MPLPRHTTLPPLLDTPLRILCSFAKSPRSPSSAKPHPFPQFLRFLQTDRSANDLLFMYWRRYRTISYTCARLPHACMSGAVAVDTDKKRWHVLKKCCTQRKSRWQQMIHHANGDVPAPLSRKAEQTPQKLESALHEILESLTPGFLFPRIPGTVGV